MKGKAKMAGLGLGLAASGLVCAVSKRRRASQVKRWQAQIQPANQHTALVTGASSGIGAAYARRLAAQGYNVVLVARREARLNQLAAEFRQRYGVQAEVLAADLSTEEGISRVEQRIVAGGDVSWLVNSAGYAVFSAFAETPIDATLGLVNCLTLAGVRFCRAALPGMLARGHGAIVNVSSIGAFVPKPRDTTYVAAKAFINLFSESLGIELAGTGVRVQALCPGFTLSEFHDAPQYAPYRIKERVPRWLWMTPDEVVSASLRALEVDRRVCVPGLKNRFIVATARTGLSPFLLGLLRSVSADRMKSATTETAAEFTETVPRKGKSPPISVVPASSRLDWLDVVACPQCRGELHLRGASQAGSLVCQSCGKAYPIVDGIPRFVQFSELTGFNRRFAHLYDWFSYVYAPYSRLALAFLGGEGRNRRELLGRLDPKGGRVLEVSIGPGVNLPYLFEMPGVDKVYGLDISLGQLRRCQALCRRRDWDVDLFLGNAEQLPFRDETFDTVFHIGGINFFNDKGMAIAEMIRVARPGTRIIVVDENEKAARSYEFTLPGFRRSFKGGREPIRPPADLVPAEMQEVCLTDVWGGWFYCLQFRKPAEG